MLLDDDALLEPSLSDANAVGLVKSTVSATLTSSGRSTYIQSITNNFLKFLLSLATSLSFSTFHFSQQHHGQILNNTNNVHLLHSRKQTCKVRNHLRESFGRPRTVLCHTTGKLVTLQKFCVTPIELSRLMTTCHQPAGTKTVSPGR